ncbi:probable G-protein coupled receptor 34 [Hemicordylus capensis]|uniref:probable G-protein coupled receptor 34 n=1 Tax=Hemicordylus capensis TaxID=884348 RepID=UPI002302B1C2|nr:probable G-protein coupled receptor 34 [Hemicordylus capensis]
MGTLSPTGEYPKNSSNTSVCEIQDGFLAITLPVMYSFIAIVGLLGNLSALWVFHFGTQKLSSITVYMKHLAISDLLLAFCLPFRAAFQNQSGPPVLCKVIGIIFYLTMYVSIFLLSLISLDRYLKIIRPLQQFRIHTVAYSTALSRGVWLFCGFTMLAFFFENRSGACGNRCFHFKRRSVQGAVLNMTAVATFFFLLLIFLYSYGRIALKLYNVSLKTTQQQSKRNSTRAALKTFVVLAIFVICFAPYHVVRVPYILAQVGVITCMGSTQALHLANELVLGISALNCCLDPVIFFFLSSSFKKAMLSATHGKLKGAFQKNQGVFGPRKSITDSRIQGS